MPLKTTVPTNPTTMIFTNGVDQTKASPDRAAARKSDRLLLGVGDGRQRWQRAHQQRRETENGGRHHQGSAHIQGRQQRRREDRAEDLGQIDPQPQAGVGAVQVVVGDQRSARPTGWPAGTPDRPSPAHPPK